MDPPREGDDVSEKVSLMEAARALLDSYHVVECKDNIHRIPTREAMETLHAALAEEEGVVYACPRCATAMEVDPTAKPSKPAGEERGYGFDEAVEFGRQLGRKLGRSVVVMKESHDWRCGCDHWNGPNLNKCALCGRRPNEQR